MKKLLGAVILSAGMGSCIAPVQAHQVAMSGPVMIRSFQVVRPNGHVVQCEVIRHFQQGRGMVNSRNCWRVR
jgi:hypothetical protein